MKTILYRWLPMCAILFATGPVIAQGTDPSAALRQYEALRKYEGTLKKIDETRTIRIGHRQNSIPFAFVDPKGKPVGYALDLCDAVVEEIETELGKEIKAELVPVTPENRFDLVTSGQIDLECGSTTNNVDRRKLVAFSPTMYVTGTKLLVPRGSKVRYLGDLKGKTVVVTRGTVQESAMKALNERQKLDLNFVTGGDHKESFQLLASGKADAWANGDVLLYGLLAETGTRDKYRVVGDFLTFDAYALMFRKDDPEFAEVVERAFQKLAESGDIRYVYDRWFLEKLPTGIRLNLPMSPHLEELFRTAGLRTD
ncbi:MAG: amino acid ABC transporter substrate-binding protein [Burkholderiales bacterium]